MEQRHEVLLNQVKMYRDWLLGSVAEITEEQADIVPTGLNNSIRWNLGHVYLDQFLWIQHLTKEPISFIPEQFGEWFNYGTSPATWSATPPSLTMLRELLEAQPDQIRELYGGRLEETFPATEAGMHTIAQVLVRTLFHEGMHLQAINDIRRLLPTQKA